jgi:hypothetical protein
MIQINFCKHTRKQFKRALKIAKREIIDDENKKRRDESKRQINRPRENTTGTEEVIAS